MNISNRTLLNIRFLLSVCILGNKNFNIFGKIKYMRVVF